MTNSREELEARVAKAEAREHALRSADGLDGHALEVAAAEHAAEHESGVVAFVKRHPLAVIGGAVALGAAASLLLPNSPTRKVGRKVSDQAVKKASALNAMAGQMALAFGAQLLEALQEARESGREKLADAQDAAEQAAKAARRSAQDARKAVEKAVRRS